MTLKATCDHTGLRAATELRLGVAHWGTVHTMLGKGHPILGLQSPLLTGSAAKPLWLCSGCPGALGALAVGQLCLQPCWGRMGPFLPAHPRDTGSSGSAALSAGSAQQCFSWCASRHLHVLRDLDVTWRTACACALRGR